VVIEQKETNGFGSGTAKQAAKPDDPVALTEFSKIGVSGKREAQV
jgi:hypothetical protein